MTEKINQIVKQMLEEHTGGKVFFEKMDEAVRTEDVLHLLYDFIKKSKTTYQIIVATGKFGKFFSNWIQWNDKTIYLVNGGLRNGDPIETLEPFQYDIGGYEFIVVDDSFYSGRTVDTIVEHVKSLGARYKGTYVVYDGSKEKRKDVKSLYRYYESE